MSELNITRGERTTYGCDIPYSKDDYIEATEWSNGEGHTFEVFKHAPGVSNVTIELTYFQIIALDAIIKRIRKDEEDEEDK